jgi:replicative DNA helicase
MSDTANRALEVEQLVIGSLLQKPELSSAIDLDPGHFSSSVYQQIYRACEDLRIAGTPIDMISVWSWLADQHPSNEWGQRLGRAMEAAYAPGNIEIYADQVKRFAVLRRLKGIGGRAFDATPGTVLEMAAGMVSELMQLEQTTITTECHIKQAVQAALNHIDEAHQQGGKIPGLTTGLIDLDTLIGGLQGGLLYIIAGRPSSGKTAFMVTLAVKAALNALKENVPIGIITMEQSNLQIALRMLSNLGRIDSVSLSRGSLQEEEWPRLTSAIGIAGSLDIWLDERPAQSLAYIVRRTREWKYKYKINALFVDYIQLVQTAEGRETRSEKLGAVSRGLKALAKELQISVIALAQLNRSLEDRSDKRPLLSDLRDSGEIEQDADVVLMLYRDEVYNEDSQDKGMAEIIVRKQRDGPLGTVHAAWLGQYCLFENCAKPDISGNPRPRPRLVVRANKGTDSAEKVCLHCAGEGCSWCDGEEV